MHQSSGTDSLRFPRKQTEQRIEEYFPIHWIVRYTDPGGRLNKKDGLTRCGDSHVKDKTS